MGGLLLLYGLWQVLRYPHGNESFIGNVWFVCFGVCQTMAAIAAARRCPSRSPLRRGWMLLACGAGLYMLGQVLWGAYELAGRIPYPSAADALSLMFYPLTLLGLLQFRDRVPDRSEQARALLDSAVVAVGGSLVVVYVVLGPTIEQPVANTLQTLCSIAYPVGDLTLLVGLGSILLRGATRSCSRALQFMAAGLLAFVAADLVYGYITLNSTYVGGNPTDTIYMVAMALFTTAAAAQARPHPEGDEIRARQPRPSWVPYVAVAGGFGLLAYHERSERFFPDFTLTLGCVLLVGLVAIRQYLAQRDLLQTQARLAHQSLHDALTDLPNRALIDDRATQLLARARRDGTSVTALYLDLDGFKHINDTLGHPAGDEVLRVTAARLRDSVRDADTAGRLGGDEFVLLLDDATLDAPVESVAERVRNMLAQPIRLPAPAHHAIVVTPSIGIAATKAGTADQLLRHADIALYEAKRAGKNRWARFEPHMTLAAATRQPRQIAGRETRAEGRLPRASSPTSA